MSSHQGTYLSLRSWIAWALWLLPFGSTIHTLWLLWMLANPSMATYLLYVSIQPWLREQESYIDEAWLWVHGLYLFSAGGVHRVWHGLRPWLWPTPSHVVEYHMPGWLTLLTPKKQPALVHHDRSDEEEVDLSLRLSPTTRSSSDDKSDEEVGDLSLHAIPWHSTPQVAAPRLVSPPWSPSMPSTTNESPRPKRSIPPTALSEGPTQRSKRTRIPTAKAVAATRSTRPTSQLPRLKRPPSPKAPTKSKAQRTTTTSPRLRPPRARRRAPSS